jgi:two-component system KDP operon response regulator KdpE
MTILVADDDPQMLRALRITLSSQGYDVVTATTGAEAITAIIDHRPELCMLDLGMPDIDGMDVIAAIRGWSSVPILVVSGRAHDWDKVDALDAGADDYVTKPFSVEELLARIRALTRRKQQPGATPVITLDNVTIDLSTHTVLRDQDGQQHLLHLTPTEWKVLELLLRNPGSLVTRQMLLTEIWGAEHINDSGYLRLYISQLRKKLEPDPITPKFLITEAGMGYRLITNPVTLDS